MAPTAPRGRAPSPPNAVSIIHAGGGAGTSDESGSAAGVSTPRVTAGVVSAPRAVADAEPDAGTESAAGSDALLGIPARGSCAEARSDVPTFRLAGATTPVGSPAVDTSPSGEFGSAAVTFAVCAVTDAAEVDGSESEGAA